MALAGSREADQDHPGAAAGRADPGDRPCGGPRVAWTAGERLPPRLHERRLEPLLLRLDGAFRAVGGGGRTTGAEVAGGSGADLWAGQETLSASASSGGHVSDAVRGTRSAPGVPPQTGLERQAEYRLCRAREFDAAADGGGPHPPELVDDAGGAAVAARSGVVAGVLPFRAAA